MLNLVQIQDRLKDMPTQAIMQYANGQNPMVPPYLALGELNRRKNMEQAAMGEQAKMQGEPPTIKQATEEQLGLMNLQKQRAMQGQQRMGQSMANAPAPVPAGVGEEPVQMARGGIARLPVRNIRSDSYAGGGIVAFQNNQDQPVSEDMPSEKNEELEKIRARTEAIKRGLGELIKAENLDPVRSSHRLVKEYIMDPFQRFITEPASIQADKFRGDKPYSYQATPEDKAKYKQDVALNKANDVSLEKQLENFDKATALFEKSREEKIAEEKPSTQVTKAAAPSAKPAVVTAKQEVQPKLSNAEKFEQMLKDRGLDIAPESGRGIEALRKSREQYEAPIYKDWTEGLLGTVQDIRSGQAIGSARARQEKENKKALADLEIKIGQAEDLRAKSDYEFKRGNFDKAVEYERQAAVLENQAMSARASMMQASKPTQIQEQMQLLKTNPELFERIYGKKDPTSDLKEVVLKEALKGWMDPTNITLRKQYKSFDDYLKTLPYFSQSGTTGVDQNLIKQADAIVSGKK